MSQYGYDLIRPNLSLESLQIMAKMAAYRWYLH